jgi:hypothetical protein
MGQQKEKTMTRLQKIKKIAFSAGKFAGALLPAVGIATVITGVAIVLMFIQEVDEINQEN